MKYPFNLRPLSRQASREIMVVETYDGDAFLGRVRLDGPHAHIYTGFVGHPKKLYVHDVASIKSWRRHSEAMSG